MTSMVEARTLRHGSIFVANRTQETSLTLLDVHHAHVARRLADQRTFIFIRARTEQGWILLRPWVSVSLGESSSTAVVARVHTTLVVGHIDRGLLGERACATCDLILFAPQQGFRTFDSFETSVSWHNCIYIIAKYWQVEYGWSPDPRWLSKSTFQKTSLQLGRNQHFLAAAAPRRKLRNASMRVVIIYPCSIVVLILLQRVYRATKWWVRTAEVTCSIRVTHLSSLEVVAVVLAWTLTREGCLYVLGHYRLDVVFVVSIC